MWSIITVARGMWETTEKFLESLIKTFDVEDYEIIYVDNASPDRRAWNEFSKWASQKRLPTKAIRYDTDTSLSKAWNDAIDISYGDTIVISNNDIEFLDNEWGKVFEAGLDEQGVGVVGLIGMSWKDTPFIQGGLFAVKLSTLYDLLLDEEQYFDERFMFTCEDVDFCKRLANRGYGIKSFEWLLNEGHVVHEFESTRKFYPERRELIQKWGHLSRVEFCYKWSYPDISIHD